MRKASLLILFSMLVSLAMMEIGTTVHAWTGWGPLILLDNIEGLKNPAQNGLFLQLVIGTTDPALAQDVKAMRAWNTNPSIDPTIYTNWFRYDEVRKTNMVYQFIIKAEYTGQYGAYNIEVTYQNDETEILTTPPINNWTEPFLPPGGLEVDFSTGNDTPTFRFMPVDDLNIDYHEVRLMCAEGPLQARMIYRTRINEWTPGQPIEVTYPQGSDGRGTEEELQPGKEYYLRALANDQDAASDPPSWQAAFRSQNRLYFSLDQDGDGITDLVDTVPNVYSDDFADTVTTSGTIDARKDQRLTITDEPDPQGVRIIASVFADGPAAAKVSACGGAVSYKLTTGDHVVVTCGSVETEAINGIVEMTLIGADGTLATTSLGAGNKLVFEPITFTITAPSSNSDDVVVVVDGKEFSIAPGEGKTIVLIDIKPGSYPNSINLGSHGLVPVAILSTDGFDATTVNPDSVELAGAGVAVRGKGSKSMAHEEDVNQDGLSDLVVQLETENLDPNEFQDGYAILKGEIYDGWHFEGQDEITIVPN